MTRPQKVFRIEHHARSAVAGPESAEPKAPAREIIDEIRALRSLIEAPNDSLSRKVVDAFRRELGEAQKMKAELDAIVQGTLDATDQILTAAEHIDRDAHLLEASCKKLQDRQCAADIKEQVVKVFEACNFQDLTGQRITKVVGTLKFIEDRIVRMMEIWGGIETFQQIKVEERAERIGDDALINGPKLASDEGHASQDDIDALFG
jgi:chemotaxis protein CheZ